MSGKERSTEINIVITGYAQHGKDTACEYLRDEYGFNFESSSRILLKEVIMPALKEKYGYASEDECYADRVNHRAEWFELLAAYNTPDKTKLGQLIFSQYDIYCGIRSHEELAALKNLYGDKLLVIWISASVRTGTAEPADSMTITRSQVDYVVYNDGDLEDLHESLDRMVDYIYDTEWRVLSND